jgi:hypothetical protein
MNKLKLSTAKRPKLYGLAAAFGLVLVLGALFSSSSHAAPAPPSLYLNPATQNVAPNTAFTVEVHENSGTTNVNALQANLSYPTANLTLNSIDYATSAFTLQAQSVGANGVINIARGQVGGLTGDQIVAVLHFTTTATIATANIAFTSGSGLANSATNTNILPSLSSTAGDSVVVAPQPSVSLTANPTTISSGQSSTLTWTSANTTNCSATTPSGWTSSTATSGTQSVSPTTTTTYTISCTGTGGTVQATATVIIPGSIGFDHNLGSGNWNGNGGSFTTTAAASSATRVVVTITYWDGGLNTVSAVTIGGANATLDKRSTNGSDFYEIWSIPEPSGLASGSTITASLPGGVGGVLMGAISLSGVDLTDGGGVASTASASGSGTNFASGTVTSPGGIVVGGAGNETTSSTTATLTTGTKVHDAWNSGSQQGFTDGYIIGGTNIAGSFSTNSTATTGAAVAYKAISIGGNPPPTATLTANPTTVNSGSSSTLTWSSTNATSCSATAPTGFTVSGTSGTKSVAPTGTTTYTISCTGAGGSTTASATVTVGSGPKAGDINGDNSVNITDLSLLLSSYGQNTTQCVTNSAYKCDLSSPGDNLVNIFDLSILLSHYGT